MIMTCTMVVLQGNGVWKIIRSPILHNGSLNAFNKNVLFIRPLWFMTPCILSKSYIALILVKRRNLKQLLNAFSASTYQKYVALLLTKFFLPIHIFCNAGNRTTWRRYLTRSHESSSESCSSYEQPSSKRTLNNFLLASVMLLFLIYKL